MFIVVARAAQYHAASIAPLLQLRVAVELHNRDQSARFRTFRQQLCQHFRYGNDSE